MQEQKDKPFTSVIIITRNRPKILSDCLDHLANQTYVDFEIIVVDSSDNYQTRDLLSSRPAVHYLSIWNGRNNMPAARNLGLSNALGDIVAFIDDDSMVFPDWLENIMSGYSEDLIGGVSGRIINKNIMVDLNDARIGQVLPDGSAIENFSKVIENPILVEWFGGCNMSFRRSILIKLNGFDTIYGGNNSYEDVDISARVRNAGYKLILIPSAVVDHVYAPRVEGVVTRDYDNPKVRYHYLHNRAYYVTKNIGLNKVYLGYVTNMLYEVTTNAIKKPCTATWKLLEATILGFIRGSWDFYFR
jgi:glycosyltransferase involved in cell wall biosynthesis